MKSVNPKVFGSLCAKHPELNGLRAGVYRETGYTPGACVVCHVEDGVLWRRKNKERTAAINKKSKAKHCATARVTTRKWRLANPEKVIAMNARGHKRYYAKNSWLILQRHREKYQRDIVKQRERGRKKVQKTLPECLARCRLRQARKISATPAWANKFFMEEAYRLAALRTKMLGHPWHVDHIVPLKSPLVCGLHVENNLQVIPASQNMAKGNRHWPDMPNERG